MDGSWQNVLTTWHLQVLGVRECPHLNLLQTDPKGTVRTNSILPSSPDSIILPLIWPPNRGVRAGAKGRAILSGGLQFIYNSHFHLCRQPLNLSFVPATQFIPPSLVAVHLGSPLGQAASFSPQLQHSQVTLRLLSSHTDRPSSCHLLLLMSSPLMIVPSPTPIPLYLVLVTRPQTSTHDAAYLPPKVTSHRSWSSLAL